MPRDGIRFFALAIVILSIAGAGAATRSTSGPGIAARERGMDAIAFIDRTFRRSDGLYADDVRKENPKRRGPAMIWPAGVELSALNAAAAIDPDRVAAARGYADALSKYLTTSRGFTAYSPVPGRDIRYFDDNEWIILDLIETYRLKNDAASGRYLDGAVATMKFVLSGESNDLGGGVWWREQQDGKNTCSNAPAICAALELNALRPSGRYVDFAQRIYTWTNAHLQDSDGLYFDHVEADGKLEKIKWSYNTAMMIRANLDFFALSQEGRYLSEARRIAAAAERHWFDAHGALRDESCFAYMLCDSLLRLASVDHQDQHVMHVRGALEFLAQHRDADGFYPRYWDAKPRSDDKGPRLIDQASAARGFLTLARFEGE